MVGLVDADSDVPLFLVQHLTYVHIAQARTPVVCIRIGAAVIDSFQQAS